MPPSTRQYVSDATPMRSTARKASRPPSRTIARANVPPRDCATSLPDARKRSNTRSATLRSAVANVVTTPARTTNYYDSCTAVLQALGRITCGSKTAEGPAKCDRIGSPDNFMVASQSAANCCHLLGRGRHPANPNSAAIFLDIPFGKIITSSMEQFRTSVWSLDQPGNVPRNPSEAPAPSTPSSSARRMQHQSRRRSSMSANDTKYSPTKGALISTRPIAFRARDPPKLWELEASNLKSSGISQPPEPTQIKLVDITLLRE